MNTVVRVDRCDDDLMTAKQKLVVPPCHVHGADGPLGAPAGVPRVEKYPR